MNRTLFLDIDGCLMHHSVGVPSNKLGFTDWKKADKDTRPFGWGGWTSRQQLDLIVDVFSNPGDTIVWCTTWELHRQGANPMFSDYINWVNHAVFPDEWLEEAFMGRSIEGGYGTGLFLPEKSGWWKQNIIEKAHTTQHEYAMVDHVIWVDDELIQMKSLKAQDMLNEYRPPQSYTLVCPQGAWSRDSIESFRL